MSGMGMEATVRVETEVCLLSPHGHTSGRRRLGQWAIPFVSWKKPVRRLASAKGIEQLQRVGADADGAGLAPPTQHANVDALVHVVRCPPTADGTALAHGSRANTTREPSRIYELRWLIRLPLRH